MSRRNLQLVSPLLQVAFTAIATTVIAAAPPQAVQSPLSPAESLQHFVLPAGLKIELVANEPNVVDPVAIRFDEDGRLWVVEMCDYPTTSVTGKNAYSRIKILEDRDSDGFYETASTFADKLRYATGLQPWRGGVFVTMAGKVAFLKDTNGDRKADINETWFTGFAQKNTQLRANHPRLALDNRIYIANGLRGGEIIDTQKPNSKPLSISGMDFRFDPKKRQFEAVTGVGQFGLTFDDYNNRFVCSNRNPAMQVVLEDWQLKKNPLVAVEAVTTDVAKAGADSRLFPVGKSWTTSHLHSGQFTAACGLDIYRGNALPPVFYGNIFVCEPTAHLVHREVMKPLGVTFTSMPAEDATEFLASPDEWFSPVNLETGPDGALYVVDMYRAVIEHPYWMPDELRKRPDLLHGRDRGRIYRIVPQEFRRPKQQRLSQLSSAQLVDFLGDPNVWLRETAARLLLERNDAALGPQLIRLAHTGSQRAQIHAIWLLQGLGLLRDELLIQLLADQDPRIVEQAIIAAESRIPKYKEMKTRIASLATSPDARVRFHALLAATPLPTIPAFPADQWELDAMLIAAGNRGGDALANMLKDTPALTANIPEPQRFISELARLAAASPDRTQQVTAIEALLPSAEFRLVGLAAVLAEASRRGTTLSQLQSQLSEASREQFELAIQHARADAFNSNLPDAARCDAINLISFIERTGKQLIRLAVDDPSQAVRLTAIAALAKQSDAEQWRELCSDFVSQSPTVKRAILTALSATPDRVGILLDAIESGHISATELDVTLSNLLLNHANVAIKQRAEKLISAVIPADREKVLADYQQAAQMDSDSARGRAIFEKNCATCHRIDELGVQVGPDISDSRERTPVQLLTDILQPNRAIDSNFFSYTVVTIDGLSHTGILTAETSTSVTLKQAEGKSITLPRNQIEELRSGGVSLMPDGLEKNIPLQDMADLIAFIKNWRYLVTQHE